MFAGMKSWNIVLGGRLVRDAKWIGELIQGVSTYASSLGLNAERTRPVPPCTGFPLPLLSSVSVPVVVVRSQVYGRTLTDPFAEYVGIRRA